MASNLLHNFAWGASNRCQEILVIVYTPTLGRYADWSSGSVAQENCSPTGVGACEVVFSSAHTVTYMLAVRLLEFMSCHISYGWLSILWSLFWVP